MQAQPDRKWSIARASILAALALAVGGLAVALPAGNEAPAGGGAQVGAEDRPPFIDDFLDTSRAVYATRDPSLAGLHVGADAEPGGHADTF